MTSSPPSSQPFVHKRTKANHKFQFSNSKRLEFDAWSLVLPLSFRSKGWAVPCGTCNTQQGLRSLPQLRERLTARTDDNHAAPGLGVQHYFYNYSPSTTFQKKWCWESYAVLLNVATLFNVFRKSSAGRAAFQPPVSKHFKPW